MEIYKNEINGKTYVTVNKEHTRAEALKIANNHFKTKKDNLIIQSGMTNKNKDMLSVGVRGNVWVISRREKA